jgi:hypothetical protein
MKRGIQESGDSKARTIASLASEPSAATEAESKLQSLVSSLSDPHFTVEELPSLIKMYMVSLCLLGIDDEWASKELRGYSNRNEVPEYRRQYRDVRYVTAKSGAVVEGKPGELCAFDESVVFMVNHREFGWDVLVEGPDKRFKGRLVATRRREHTMKWHIDVVLDRIGVELFARASETLVTAKFGVAIDTIFRDYQKAVGSALSNLEIADHLETAYVNLKRGDEASWRAAALACRNIVHDLSAKLWCVQCGDYNFGDDRGLVKLDNPRIKLRAYMREKGLDKKDTPVALLDPLYAEASAAKIRCSYKDARSVLIVTYLFLAELIRQTDMKPVTEIKKGSSKGKE